MAAGMLIEVIPVSANAKLLILPTLSGMVNEVRLVHPLKVA